MTSETANLLAALTSIGFAGYLALNNMGPALPEAEEPVEQLIRRNRKRQMIYRLACAGLILGIARLVLGGGLDALRASPKLTSWGGFEVTFPGSVTERTVLQRAGNDSLVIHRAEFSDDERGLTCETGWFDLDPGKTTTPDLVAQAIAGKWGNSISERPIRVEEKKGTELIYSIDSTHRGRCRIFIGQERVCWQLQKVAEIRTSDPDVVAFFDSFHFRLK